MTEPSRLNVSTADLRAAFEAVIAHIEEGSGTEVALPDDYFWWIQCPAVYDVGTRPQPDSLTIGQLSEAWQFLLDSVRTDGVVSQSAVWLSQVLRAVGEAAVG